MAFQNPCSFNNMFHSYRQIFCFQDPPGGKVWNILSITVGGIVAISLGLLTSVYVATLHENDLWFSNIKVIIIFLVSSVVLWSVNMSIS